MWPQVGLLSTIGPDLVVLVLKPELPHALPSPIALAVLDTISPARFVCRVSRCVLVSHVLTHSRSHPTIRVVALDSYIASSYLPSAEEEATRTLAEDDSDGEERLRFLATSSAYKPAVRPPPFQIILGSWLNLNCCSFSLQTGLHPFSPPNHLLSSVAPFLTLLPLSEPPTPLFLLPAPRPTLATLRRLANVLREELGETAAWDEARFVKGGRKNRWGRKEVDAGSMYM